MTKLLRKVTHSSVVEAEACGDPYIVVAYRDHEFKLPTDADSWPLRLIANSVGVRDSKLVADYLAVTLALSALLGEQWQTFMRAYPKRGDLIPASRAFAAAAGFDAATSDLAFGALPRLLSTIELYSDAVEATLAALNVDYRDRFRFDADDRRILTLRQIHVRLKYAPFNNALTIAQNNGRPRLTGTELLLMDVFEQIARRVHPSRPMTEAQKQARATKDEKVEAERAKYRARHSPQQRKQAAIETARANAQHTQGKT